MLRPCHPLLLRFAAVAALVPAMMPGAHARPDRDYDTTGEARADEVSGFVPQGGLTFDLPADPARGSTGRWNRLETGLGPAAYVGSGRGPGLVTGQRDVTGAGSVGAALQSQTPGFIAKTGVTFDIPADPYPGFAQGWDRVDMARRAASGKAEASLGLQDLPWFVPFWQSARVEASFDPQADAGTGQVAAVLSRSWSLIGLTGTSEDRYAVIRDGLLGPQAPITRWEIDRKTRLELPWHSTALVLGGQVSSTDRRPTASIGAEQTLFGPLKVNASLVELGSTQPGASFSANINFSW
jgi:hypothetical protein